jgi:hypothetical protein
MHIRFFTHFISFPLSFFFLSSFLALIKTAIGATIGGFLGVIMFRSGSGSRAATVAAGVGVAAGSTYQRIAAKMKSP